MNEDHLFANPLYGFGIRDLRTPAGFGSGTAELDALLGQLSGNALFGAEADYEKQCREFAVAVVDPTARGFGARNRTAGHRRHHVYQRPTRNGFGNGRKDRYADLAIHAPTEDQKSK